MTMHKLHMEMVAAHETGDVAKARSLAIEVIKANSLRSAVRDALMVLKSQYDQSDTPTKIIEVLEKFKWQDAHGRRVQ